MFRGVAAGGRLGERLSTDDVRHILLSRARLAKLTVHASERLSPHGLRAGFITEAYLAAAPDEQVMAPPRPHHGRQPGPPARSLAGMQAAHTTLAEPRRRLPVTGSRWHCPTPIGCATCSPSAGRRRRKSE